MKKKFFGIIWNFISKLLNVFFRRMFPLIKGIYSSKIFTEEFNRLEKNRKYDLILIRGQGTFELIWKFKDPRSVRICVNVSPKLAFDWKDALRNRCYFNNTHVSSLAQGVENHYRKRFIDDNVNPLSLTHIYNPFFPEKVYSLMEENNSSLLGFKYILGLGRLVKQKNFELLIDSFKEFKDTYKNNEYKLLIVGDGSSKDGLVNQVKELKLENDVVFAGHQSNPYNWIYKSEMVVITSNNEGLCNVLIESMCCKTRVVINDCPGGTNELMVGKLKNNIALKSKYDIAKKMNDVLNLEKSVFFEDYEKVLSSMEPKVVVNKWVKRYIEKADINV